MRDYVTGVLHLMTSLASIPRWFGRALIKAYRYSLSGLIGRECRHLPTCSEYGDEALARFGLWAGGWMTLARVLRCQPFGTSGLDFVPSRAPDRARWYLPWRYGRWRGVNAAPPETAPGHAATRSPETASRAAESRSD